MLDQSIKICLRKPCAASQSAKTYPREIFCRKILWSSFNLKKNSLCKYNVLDRESFKPKEFLFDILLKVTLKLSIFTSSERYHKQNLGYSLVHES